MPLGLLQGENHAQTRRKLFAFTLVSYPSGEKKEDHEDDAHYSAQKNPTPLLRHTECDGRFTFLINALLPHF
jgi:hypothetical protein